MLLFSSRTCCRCKNKALNDEWLLLDLATIDPSDLVFSYSSSSASALVPPVSVLMSPCTIPVSRAWSSSVLFCLTHDDLKFVCCFFSTPTVYSLYPLVSALPKRIVGSSSQTQQLISNRASSACNSCPSGIRFLSVGTLQRQWLPESLLARYGRRRRSFSSCSLSLSRRFSSSSPPLLLPRRWDAAGHFWLIVNSSTC